MSPTVTDKSPITNSPIDKSKWFKVGQILQSFTRNMESSHCRKKNSLTSLALYSWGREAITLPRYLARMVIDNGKINFFLWRQMLAEEQMSRNYLLIHTQCKWEEDDKAIPFSNFMEGIMRPDCLYYQGLNPLNKEDFPVLCFWPFWQLCSGIVLLSFLRDLSTLGKNWEWNAFVIKLLYTIPTP